MNYYNEIKQKLIDNEIYSNVKDYSKERHRVITYFEIGKLLNEAGSIYVKNIIRQYSVKLMTEVGKKYNERTLYRMRKLYQIFSSQNLTPLVSKLTWSHYLVLLPIKDVNKIVYYINQATSRNLSKRQLQDIIKSNEYERLPGDTKNKLISNSDDYNKVTDFIKNPIVIRNTSNYETISEKVLKKVILEDIDNFLKELGSGFCYIENEYKNKIGNRYNYIDLLLFNYIYNCFVVIELKVMELKKEHIGQIQVYMNYIDKNIRKMNQDKTIGIIICKKDNKFILEYCSDKRILSKQYILI